MCTNMYHICIASILTLVQYRRVFYLPVYVCALAVMANQCRSFIKARQQAHWLITLRLLLLLPLLVLPAGRKQHSLYTVALHTTILSVYAGLAMLRKRH